MISFFLLPKGVLHKLDYYWYRFFWQGDIEKKKYQLAGVLCALLKTKTGLVFMTFKNTALLGKWHFMLLIKEGTWQTFLKRKYIGTKALSQVLWKPGDSHF
jgi:hypothetical protein